MITFKRLARTKQYARGNDKPSSFITSAMQIVADLETPTRQCTSVAVPFLRPFSAVDVSECTHGDEMPLTDKLQTSAKFLGERIDSVVLYLVYE